MQLPWLWTKVKRTEGAADAPDFSHASDVAKFHGTGEAKFLKSAFSKCFTICLQSHCCCPAKVMRKTSGSLNLTIAKKEPRTCRSVCLQLRKMLSRIVKDPVYSSVCRLTAFGVWSLAGNESFSILAKVSLANGNFFTSLLADSTGFWVCISKNSSTRSNSHRRWHAQNRFGK
jgi:hypothetical protein